MSEKIYTILDLAEEFGKDKQSIRRSIARLRLQSLNKDTRKYSNDPLEYNYESYLELAKDFGISKSNTSDTHNNARNDTLKYDENLSKDKLIEVLERELKHSKDKLENAEQEKENLYKLLSQQQHWCLSDKNKIKLLELDLEAVKDPTLDQKERYKPKWYYFFTKKKDL